MFIREKIKTPQIKERNLSLKRFYAQICLSKGQRINQNGLLKSIHSFKSNGICMAGGRVGGMFEHIMLFKITNKMI